MLLIRGLIIIGKTNYLRKSNLEPWLRGNKKKEIAFLHTLIEQRLVSTQKQITLLHKHRASFKNQIL